MDLNGPIQPGKLKALDVDLNHIPYAAMTIAVAALFADGFPHQAAVEPPRPDGPWHIGFVVTPSHEGVFVRCMSGIVNRLDRRRFRPTLICARPGEGVLRAAIPAGTISPVIASSGAMRQGETASSFPSVTAT